MYNVHHSTKHPTVILRQLISAPFIYAVIIPTLFLDIVLEIYHRICFPLYGIPYVKRSEYIRFDRWKLPYLNIIEKVNCIYCEYVNGFYAYAVAVAGSTELYWCSLKHQSGGGFHEPDHQKNFLPYGDEEAFNRYIAKSRRKIRKTPQKTTA
ncbi:hypothetical protein COW46_04560 [Candidatus Gracilibacteria bacterium CG17_big_fil_post_rev_8_21_14_2_50_48_13]|nr:MAG: hypothetical protein COW46_04560 [Candidatus Gracilibacteria bacterium CG17_big_fil_post_rev_8_21_14_2_50_48_13]